MNAKKMKYMRALFALAATMLLIGCFIWAFQQAVVDEFHISGVESFSTQESIRLALDQRYHGRHMSIDEHELRDMLTHITPTTHINAIEKEWLTGTIRVALREQADVVRVTQSSDICEPYRSLYDYKPLLASILYAYQIPLQRYTINCLGDISATGNPIAIELGNVTDDIQANLILLQHLLNRFAHRLAAIEVIDMRYAHGVAIRWKQTNATHTQTHLSGETHGTHAHP